MRLHDFLDYWAREQPAAPFARQQDTTLSYQQALAAVNRLANALVAAQLRPGDRIAVLSKNRIEYLLLYLAASKAGVVPVPLNFRLSPPQWSYIINDASARLLIGSAAYAEALAQVRSELRSVERCISLDPTSQPGWERYADWVAGQPTDPPAVEVDAAADVYQMYTSGTTGQPKGAVLTQRAVTANMLQVALATQARPGEWSLAVLPLFHAAVVPTVFAPLACGGAIFLLQDFIPAEIVAALSGAQIAVATLVPAMLQACLLQVPDIAERRYAQLRLIYYGASPISEETLRRAVQVFPCGFMQSYGLTEATQSVSFLTPADHKRALAGHPELLTSAGRPALGTEIRIVDPAGRPVPRGTIGEIAVRGPQLMRGYHNQPEESSRTLRGGWLHTGDAGLLDDQGYLYVKDRVKDMIISGGENIYPAVIENVLYQHPAVAEAAVIGVPDQRWGEAVKAVVVLKAGASSSTEELISFCRMRLAGYEIPRSVDFTDALPRNPSGKVLKRVLREPYWTGQERMVSGS